MPPYSVVQFMGSREEFVRIVKATIEATKKTDDPLISHCYIFVFGTVAGEVMHRIILAPKVGEETLEECGIRIKLWVKGDDGKFIVNKHILLT